MSSPPRGLGRVPVLAAASFATSTQSFVYAGLLNEIAQDLQVPVSQAGQLGTAFALAFGLSAIPMAALCARVPRRRLMVAALAAMALLNLGMVLAPTFPLLLALRVLCGVAAAVIVPSASAAAATLAPPEQRARALALVIGGTTAAFLLGIPLGSVAGSLLGWHGAFGLTAVLCGASALAIRLVLPEVPGEGRAGGSLRVLRRPGVLPMLGLAYLSFSASFCTSAFIGPAVNAVSGLAGWQVGLMQTLSGVASMLGLPIGTRLYERQGIRAARWMPLAILLAQSLQAALLLGLLRGHWLAIPAQALALLASSTGVFAMMPMVQARLVALAPDARVVVLAANSAGIYLGQASGAAAGGLAIAAFGLPGMGIAGALLACCALALAFRVAFAHNQATSGS
ncbi:MFS transporter [Roseomonas haemaphysalidis]|uniref:MFS transporter n=1 Tax=Roseomonas haemaphysalidis TaxID=2768162 RepID=A0ABS3KNB2_9PROT|nr:MFS transporter [Roseomonas haemaphysalidis]MBO1078955.1 MFS transporter [Roseomonas haemaphysalidis]